MGIIAIFAPNVTAKAIQYSDYIAEDMKMSDNFLSSLSKITTEESKIARSSIVAKLDLSDILWKVILCESGGKHEGIFGDNGKAYGILQFHRPTFDQFCKGDYYNKEDQLRCGIKMFSQGLAHHWSCYNKIYANRSTIKVLE